MKIESLFDANSAHHAARLIDFAYRLTAADIPRGAFDNAKRCLLDAIGCGLFGANQPWSVIMAAQMYAEKSQGASTVFGHREALAAPAAALCNGTAIHGFELDDLLPAAIIHPGTVIVPAVLAAAEGAGAGGEQLLRALIIGYEATARISIAMGTQVSHHGFHKTSVVGPVSAAIAASCVLGLNTAQITCAAGIAASMASGVKAYVAGGGGGMVKRMHAGWAASSGVRAALLARDGFTGPAGAVDGRYGLLEVFGGAAANPQALTQGLGEHWAINEVWFKVYPLCGWIQGVVQLLGDMRGEINHGRPLAADQIRRVVVGTSRFAVNSNSNPAPADTMDAQYSIPYCAAVALTGDPGDPRAFEPAAYNDPALRALATRVETRVDDECEAVYPQRFGSRVQLHLASGEMREALTLDPHGTPGDPCSDQELTAKFTRLAALSPLKVDSAAIVDTIRLLDTRASLCELGRVLRSA
jgi:2-methylcitrate dehydratase PrpD